MNVQSLLREVRARYQQLENAKGVFQKYKDFSEKDQIPPQLRSLASMQWPHFYLACAAPVAHEHDMEFQQDNASYKVDVRFQDLVKSHQRSQREFILLHATQCLQTAEDRESVAAFQALADELVYNHCEIFVGEIPDQQVAAKRRDLTATLYALVALLREQQVFAMKSRADKEAKKRQKREDELAKAELAWEALPPAVLVGLAAHQESGGGPARKAQGQERIAVGNNPVLKRLLMPHEDQLKKLGFILDISSQPSSAAPKQRSKPPSTGSTSSAGRGRGKGKTPSQPSSAARSNAADLHLQVQLPMQDEARAKARAKAEEKEQEKDKAKEDKACQKIVDLRMGAEVPGGPLAFVFSDLEEAEAGAGGLAEKLGTLIWSSLFSRDYAEDLSQRLSTSPFFNQFIITCFFQCRPRFFTSFQRFEVHSRLTASSLG